MTPCLYPCHPFKEDFEFDTDDAERWVETEMVQSLELKKTRKKGNRDREGKSAEPDTLSGGQQNSRKLRTRKKKTEDKT